jgi:hypothetical protein
MASEALPRRLHPTTLGIAVDQILERQRVVMAKVFRLLERKFNDVDGGDRGEIEEGPGNGGDGNPLLDRRLVLGQSAGVATKGASRAGVDGRRYFDGMRTASSNTPECRRRAMAQHRPITGSQHRRHPPAPLGQRLVSHRIDPRLNQMKPARVDSPPNRTRAEPKARSCDRPTTPCCLVASSDIARSTGRMCISSRIAGSNAHSTWGLPLFRGLGCVRGLGRLRIRPRGLRRLPGSWRGLGGRRGRRPR